VVDDGSTDSSHEVLEQYKSRVSLILKENAGQSSAFNAGFQASTGEFVAFLDSDDLLRPDAVALAVAAWDAQAVKVQFPLEVLDANGRTAGSVVPRGKLSSGNLLREYLETGTYITPPTSGNLFSRAFLNSILPIPEKEWAHADAYINVCVPFYGAIVTINQPLGFYRVHGKSMSSVNSSSEIDVDRMRRMVGMALQAKAFLETLAIERGLKVSKAAVVSQWTHVKLTLAITKLGGSGRRTTLIPQLMTFSVSIAGARELTLLRKLQHLIWAISVTVLPRPAAAKLIGYAFDLTPRSRFLRLLRRS